MAMESRIGAVTEPLSGWYVSRLYELQQDSQAYTPLATEQHTTRN